MRIGAHVTIGVSMTQGQSEPAFLTVAEVADVVRVSRMTVYRMVHSGELPAVRVGRSFRVPRSAVDTMLAEGSTWNESATGTD